MERCGLPPYDCRHVLTSSSSVPSHRRRLFRPTRVSQTSPSCTAALSSEATRPCCCDLRYSRLRWQCMQNSSTCSGSSSQTTSPSGQHDEACLIESKPHASIRAQLCHESKTRTKPACSANLESTLQDVCYRPQGHARHCAILDVKYDNCHCSLFKISLTCAQRQRLLFRRICMACP